ncbi:hypothetical protein Tco_1017866 [Tanacetum coccineum]|uniref:Uncharacterized protein n=1 Tax=Tanacetum coccineum TaxID=301880 RepID=A0ABQ5FSQ6_9ASTR
MKTGSKRAGDELEQENAKKQKVDDDKETIELQSLMDVIPDEVEVVVDGIPLATKAPSNVDYKIIKEGKISYYQIIRADGSSKRYSAFIQMLRSFDRENLETLWKLVKAKHGYTRPEEGYKSAMGFQSLHVFMLVEKRYPLTPTRITKMLNKKLQADHWNEMCYQLLCSSQSNSRINEVFGSILLGRIVKIKRLLDDLRATATQVRVTAAKHNLLLSLMLLVQKLLLLVFRVNAASTKLQLLKDYDSWKSFYCQGMDKDCLEKR